MSNATTTTDARTIASVVGTDETTGKPQPGLIRMTDGRFLLVNVPFTCPDLTPEGKKIIAARILGVQGMGLKFAYFENGRGWVCDTREQGREAAAKLADGGVYVGDYAGKKSVINMGAEVAKPERAPRATRATARTAGPVTVTRVAPKPVAPKQASPVNATVAAESSIAEVITAALVKAGVPVEVIAASVAAAVETANELARSATREQATPKQATPKQATPKQATPKQATPVKASVKATVTDGMRQFVVTAANIKGAATAARKALSAAKITGVSIKVDAKSHTLTAYRADGAAVDAAVDAVIIAAAATIA